MHWGCHYEAATVLDIGLILNAAALVADEEGSSSKKAVFAATAKGAAPGVT